MTDPPVSPAEPEAEQPSAPAPEPAVEPSAPEPQAAAPEARPPAEPGVEKPAEKAPLGLGSRRRGQLTAAVLFGGLFALCMTMVAASSGHHGFGRSGTERSLMMLLLLAQTVTVALWVRWRGALLGEGKRGIGALALPALLPLLMGVIRGYTDHARLRGALEEVTEARLFLRVALEGAGECVAWSAMGALVSGGMLLVLGALGLFALRTLPEPPDGEASPWLGPTVGAWCLLLVVGLLHTRTTVDFGPVDLAVLLALLITLVAGVRLLRRQARLEAWLGEGWARRASPALGAVMVGLCIGVPLLAWGELQLVGVSASSLASSQIEYGVSRELLERIDRARELRPLVAAADALIAAALLPLALPPAALSAALAGARRAAFQVLVPLGIALLAVVPEQLMTRRVVSEAAAFFDRFDGDPGLALPTLPRWTEDPPRGPAVLLRRKGDIWWDDKNGLGRAELLAEDHPARYVKAWERSQDLDVVPLTLDLLIAGDGMIPFGNVRAVTRLLERTGLPWRFHLLAWTSAEHAARGEVASIAAKAQLGAAFPFDVMPRSRFHGALERQGRWVVVRAGEPNKIHRGGEPVAAGEAGEADLAIAAGDRATLGEIAEAWRRAAEAGARPRRVVVVAEDDGRGEPLASR